MTLSRVAGLLMFFAPFIIVSIILESTVGIEGVGVLWGILGFTSIYLAVAFHFILKDEYWS